MTHVQYNCVIVDDEPKAIELLKDSLHELYNNINITGTYTNWKDALEALRANNFDLLFLDISMPQKNGMALLELVPGIKCEIIFVTAYSEHAVDAFNVGATGYVLKPINDALLVKAVDKAIERIDIKKAALKPQAGGSSGVHKIGIPSTRGTDYVNVDEILYLEATNRYTSVVKKTEKLLSSYSIGKYKSMLEPYMFCQVHRSFIVNLKYVTRYEHAGAVTMSNGVSIPVSKQHKDEFQFAFNKLRNKADAEDQV